MAITSPELNTYGFLHCWGHVKQHVYSKRIMHVQHLIQRIQEGVTATAADILQNVWQDLQTRVHL